MKIAICHDDPRFVEELMGQIRRYGVLRNVSILFQICYSSDGLLAEGLRGCDLLLLDPDMPGVAPETARVLGRDYPELLLVLLSGGPGPAPAEYPAAFRCLLKTDLPEALFRCLDEARQHLEENPASLTLRTRDRTLAVSLRRILYFEGTARRAVKLYLTDGPEPLECPGRLGDYEARLRDKGFLRIQRSYLVNMDQILRIRNYYALLTNGRELKVSERQFSQVRDAFLARMGRL